MKKELICYCESKVELDVPEQIDLSAEPAVRRDILEGRFLTVPCSVCGKLLKPEFPVRLDKAGRGMDIYFIPELDRVAFLREKLSYPLPETDRVAIGYEELVEKLRLADADLDDRVVELIKYYLYTKAVENAEAEGDIRIVFQSRKADTLVFHVHGLKADEVGVLSVPEAMVDKAAAQLEEKMREEPFVGFLRGSYVSLSRIFSEAVE
jgi:hypothetical protein